MEEEGGDDEEEEDRFDPKDINRLIKQLKDYLVVSSTYM